MSDAPRKRRSIRVGDSGKRRFQQRSGERLEKATAWLLRDLFNQYKIEEKAARGEITTEIVSNEHPTWPLAKEPHCTRSQMLEYYDKTGRKLAAAHRYLRPDGTIGLQGRPDPKQVFHEGVMYYSDI